MWRFIDNELKGMKLIIYLDFLYESEVGGIVVIYSECLNEDGGICISVVLVFVWFLVNFKVFVMVDGKLLIVIRREGECIFIKLCIEVEIF